MIDFTDNPLTDKTARKIVDLIARSAGLECLNMSGTKITKVGLSMIFSVLHEGEIREFHARDLNEEVEFYDFTIENQTALEQNTSLKVMDLKGTLFDTTSIAAIGHMLKKNQTMEKLMMG